MRRSVTSSVDVDVLPVGYKLASTDGSDYPLCAHHLANAWRMYTAYPDDARVVIVAVDQHLPKHNPVQSSRRGPVGPRNRRPSTPKQVAVL